MTTRTSTATRHSLLFLSDSKVEVVEETMGALPANKVRILALASGISSGTEMLVYRGDVNPDLPVDETIDDLPDRRFRYPLKYGYTTVGRVEQVGDLVDSVWKDCLVFAFHPHESRFDADPATLVPVPKGVSVEDALYLANAETAVNFVLDGQPRIGERVLVFGLGVLGALTTSLLATFPHGGLVALDPLGTRRALDLGADAMLDPDQPDLKEQLKRTFVPGADVDGADLVFELSGNPEALDRAIELTGYHGRIVIGSWYGEKAAQLHLGGRFHRSRIKLITSQVSSIAPELRGRWTRDRRFSIAWETIREVHPARWISHRFPIERAGEAYDLIDRNPGESFVTILTYGQE
ncbi:zinc-binding alcohol dehydrogenase [bacterium]|nr:zinc-binding alcohol dehydrogenase [bacterium]